MLTVEMVERVTQHFINGNRYRYAMVSGRWPTEDEDREVILRGRCCLVAAFIGCDETVPLSNYKHHFADERKQMELLPFVKEYCETHQKGFIENRDRRYACTMAMLPMSFNDENDDSTVLSFLNWLKGKLSDGST